MMKKEKLNKCLLVAFILGVLYSLWSVVYWGSAVPSAADGSEALGAGIATAIIMPHMVCSVLATIFNGLGLFMRKRGFALTGAILYTVALVLFIPYFYFVIIQMILSYIGFAKLGKSK